MKGLKSFRNRAGYSTQMALAKELGIGTANVSEWELGRGYPSYLVIKKLLELGATVEELFGIEYANKSELTETDDVIEKRILQILKKMLLKCG